MKKLLYILSVLIFIQCEKEIERDLTPVSALAPIYTTINIGDNVSGAPRSYSEFEDIEFYEGYILIIEASVGIHVIDNSDSENPINVGFLELPGITSFAINSEFLIASLANHLIKLRFDNVLDGTVTAITSLSESQIGNGSYPTDPNYNGKFECVDLSKGIVSSWELKDVIDPKCEVFN